MTECGHCLIYMWISGRFLLWCINCQTEQKGKTMADNVSPVKLVKEFFGMNLAQMKAEWVTLPEKDKAQILAGLQDGTLNY